MKKILSLSIIGVLLLSAQTFRPALAEEEAIKTTPYIEACLDKLPAYTYPTEPLIHTEKQERMEEASLKFHEYVGCLFDGMVTEIVKLNVSNLPENFSAYTPTFPDIRSPAEACKVDTDAAKTVIAATSTDILAGRIGNSFDDYSKYMRAVLEHTEYPGQDVQLTRLAEQRNELRLYFENEMETTITALKTTLHAAKEMRQAYMLHIQFNCWINHLEGWRNMLEEIRKVVIRLPNKLIDASTICSAP